MIRIAVSEDLPECQNILRQIGRRENVTKDTLYLNDSNNGFSIVVERESRIIALSTFTIRRINRNNKNLTSLYWENLIVDKFNRDGVAYLTMIGYVKKVLRRGEFDDIYFIARRKKAIEAHKAARFKNFGYFHLMIESIVIKRKVVHRGGYSCLDYRDFATRFDTDGSASSKPLKAYKGLENTSKIEIQRWLFGKKGKVVIDDLKKRLFFLRSLIKNKYFEVNLFIPGSYTEDIPDLSELNTALITITLKITRSNEKHRKAAWIMPKLTYEALSFNEKKSLTDFELWEHDAW